MSSRSLALLLALLALLAIATALWWPAVERNGGVRLMPATGVDQAPAALAGTARAQTCTAGDLAAWQLVGEPDLVAMKAVLFNEQRGAVRASIGQTLGQGVSLASMNRANVALACPDAAIRRTLSIELDPRPSGKGDALRAPLGN